jgi:DNA-binding HxlR family transcriptional regulator
MSKKNKNSTGQTFSAFEGSKGGLMGDPKDQETPPPAQGYESLERAGGSGPVEHKSRIDQQEAGREFNPIDAIVQVVEADNLIASQIVILVVLFVEMAGTGRCEMNYEAISVRSKMSTRAVTRQLSQLEKQGWIKRTRKYRIYSFEPGERIITGHNVLL